MLKEFLEELNEPFDQPDIYLSLKAETAWVQQRGNSIEPGNNSRRHKRVKSGGSHSGRTGGAGGGLLSAFGLGALRGYYCHLELQIRICLLPNVKFFKLFFDNLVAQSWHDKVSKLEELSVDGLTVEPTFLIDELEESIVVLVELDQELGSQSSHIGW